MLRLVMKVWCLEFKKKDLKQLLGREVDLVVDGSLRPYAQESVERDKILVYERAS